MRHARVHWPNMEQQEQKNASLFAELKRRNIFRVALLYLVAALLVLQLADVLFEQLGIPAWAFRLFFALVLICFPAVMAFSWICEITPQGLKREQNIDAETSITTRTGRKINRITLVLLAFAILIPVVDKLIPESTPVQATGMNNIATYQALPVNNPDPVTIDLQGHRGARGLLPENSIPAFLHALDLGVTTLEMDTAINAEGHVVVSHEPWMSAKICSFSDGREITENEEKTLRIFAMSDAEVASFDCGSRGHPDYPRQQAMPVSKPLLSDVFSAVVSHAEATDRNASYGQVLFNIEIKSLPEGDRIFHPEVTEFANALYNVVHDHGLVEQTTIQSFDPRALEAVFEIDPQISIALLVENQGGLQQNLGRISFVPQIYSPDYQLIDQAQIDAAHELNIQVIPWTVNDEQTMRELLEMGVDGLITDYPDLGVEVLAEIQKTQ
jgi:glycerophosphoryl diester phosphodiesterase